MKLAIGAKQLDEQVDAFRDTISKVENGKRTTYPFDVALAHQIYTELFGPFAAASPPVKHLIFEPDGAIAAADQPAGDGPGLGRRLLDDQRAKASDDAAYDFRGIAWLGRDRDISTAVSPRSFAQLRSVPPSAGRREYLGLGENTPPQRWPRAKSRRGGPRLHPALVVMGTSHLGEGA